MIAAREKILLLASALQEGGAQRVYSILLRHLDRNAFEPHVALLRAQGTYVEDLPKDVTVHDLCASRIRYSVPRIVKLIRKLRPKAVMSTMLATNLALILTKPFLPRGTRLLIREAGTPSRLLSDHVDHPLFWRSVYRNLYKHADRVICLSDAMASEMVELFKLPPEKVVRIYNPLDEKRVRELGEQGDNPYSGPGPHLVSAGRLSHEKGFDVLVAALPRVLERLPKAELVILGEGHLKKDLIEQATRLGLNVKVRFPGFQSNPWRYFRHADLFVLASRHEGMPNAVLEALALGTAVVATDCPGGIREIQGCAPGMILAPPEDPEALAEAIISTCTDGKSSQKPQQCRPDLSKFNLQQVVREYSELF
ncbi:MAG TPA: glycosyltransferase [Candidatus Angelobacter sp.]